MKASSTKRSVGVLTDDFCFNLPDDCNDARNRSAEHYVLKPSVTISHSRKPTLKELARATSKTHANNTSTTQASHSCNKLSHCGFQLVHHLPGVRPSSRHISSYRANDAIMNLPRTKHRQAFRPSVPYKLSQHLLLARLFPTLRGKPR